MISVIAKKHDNLSIEFKLGYKCIEKSIRENFKLNMWLFIPNSLGINPEIYGKDQFYRDIKSNVRLITPVFSLEEISSEKSLPFSFLEFILEKITIHNGKTNMADYEYHVKMFAAIFKSALRRDYFFLINHDSVNNLTDNINKYIANTKTIISRFRELTIDRAKLYPEYVAIYAGYVDEFMTNILEEKSIRLLHYIKEINLLKYCLEINSYRKSKNYPTISGNNIKDRDIVYRMGMLKKYAESDLYVELKKKRDGFAAEQFYYSIAAGFAMIFATAVAWYTQMKYGNITQPLFIVLVISYMMKDRIKDLMRYFFSNKIVSKLYDKKGDVYMSKRKVGIIQEGVNFVDKKKVPLIIMQGRNKDSEWNNESNLFEEKVLLYKKNITVFNKKLKKANRYSIDGLNEIMRLHLTRFTQKMDNPEIVSNYILPDGNIRTTSIQKIYYINAVFELISKGNIKEYYHFRITMNRDGIISVTKI